MGIEINLHDKGTETEDMAQKLRMWHMTPTLMPHKHILLRVGWSTGHKFQAKNLRGIIWAAEFGFRCFFGVLVVPCMPFPLFCFIR